MNRRKRTRERERERDSKEEEIPKKMKIGETLREIQTWQSWLPNKLSGDTLKSVGHDELLESDIGTS